MLARLWDHYWVGLWIVLAGPAVAALWVVTAKAVDELNPDTIDLVVFPLFFGGFGLGAAMVVRGVAVWGYKFHTEGP